MLQAVTYVSETGKDFSRNRDEQSQARISGRDQNGSYGSSCEVTLRRPRGLKTMTEDGRHSEYRTHTLGST
jgi:hypothetical protein